MPFLARARTWARPASVAWASTLVRTPHAFEAPFSVLTMGQCHQCRDEDPQGSDRRFKPRQVEPMTSVIRRTCEGRRGNSTLGKWPRCTSGRGDVSLAVPSHHRIEVGIRRHAVGTSQGRSSHVAEFRLESARLGEYRQRSYDQLRHRDGRMNGARRGFVSGTCGGRDRNASCPVSSDWRSLTTHRLR